MCVRWYTLVQNHTLFSLSLSRKKRSFFTRERQRERHHTEAEAGGEAHAIIIFLGIIVNFTTN